jgi:hypothetical protein
MPMLPRLMRRCFVSGCTDILGRNYARWWRNHDDDADANVIRYMRRYKHFPADCQMPLFALPPVPFTFTAPPAPLEAA